MGDVDGWVADGFEAVRDAFEENFRSGKEVGASFAAYHHGTKVADLWGGTADRRTGRPWGEDALVLVYSTTKGATAVCANLLAQRGELDVDAPVADYWPEFAQAGKERVTVAHLLAHQAGLAWIDGTMGFDDVLAWDPVVEALAAQAPSWEPGTQHGYHATTYGWLVGEVVRRISGRSLGTFFREEVAEPLGLDWWIGLPAEQEPRVAPLIGWGMDEGGASERPASSGGSGGSGDLFSLLGADSPLVKALTAPGGALTGGVWNRPELRAAEIPAANGVADARSIARMYAAVIGEVDGVRILDEAQTVAARTPRTSGPNTVLFDLDIQFGLGFMLHSSLLALGGPSSFGHFGAGGSVGWADPDAGLTFGYAMNRMDLGLAGDVRSFGLIQACYEAVA